MMRQAAVAVLVSALLAACSTKMSAPPPEIEASLITELRDGHADLTCGAACSGNWTASVAGLNRLYAAGDWRHLASQVMWIGYQNDLGYYYLGRSGEGLGAPRSALIYYRKAGAVTAGPDPQLKCNAGGHDACNGLSFPRDLYPRIQAVRNEIAHETARAHPAAQRSAPTGVPVERVFRADEPWIDPPAIVQ
jgi:hypothetical protein